MQFLLAVLLIILLIFGITSGLQSYASAKQAQAQIEVAHVAQINAWGNLIVILVLALLILCVLAFIVWVLYKRMNSKLHPLSSTSSRPRMTARVSGQLPNTSLDTLIQLKTLEMLDRMTPPQPTHPQITAPIDDEDSSW